MNKNLEGVDTIHTQYNSREIIKKARTICLYKRYI